MSGRWAHRPEADCHSQRLTCQNATELQNSYQQHAASATSSNPPPQNTVPHYPAHFTKGSIIQLASGDLKRIEDLSTEDFVRSADISKDLCIDTSVVQGITPVTDRGTVMLEFSVGPGQVQIEVESTVEHPFYVYNRGWSSCCPERTLQRYKLSCHQLMVSDRCISLTQKNSSLLPTSFVNGSLAQVKDWNAPVTQVLYTQPTPSISRTRLASDSAVLSWQFQQRQS